MQQDFDASIIRYLEAHREDFIADIQELVAIHSEEDIPHAEKNAPFGPGIARCLKAALAQCEKAGLKTRNFHGYAGDATWGEGEGAVAVLTHLDTVPLGDGWTRAPLGGTVEGDLIYGRGTNDDKGPGVCALWAVKALMAAGFTPQRPLRLIYGCNEETGSQDLVEYLKEADVPAFAFTPDANFPVIHAEKASVGCRPQYCFTAPTVITHLHAGTRVNVVPNLAEAVLDAQHLSLPERAHITCTQTDHGLTRITATGQAAHASMPQDGLNAIGLLMQYLKDVLPSSEGAYPAVAVLADAIGLTYDGAGCKVACADAVSGPLTFNLGLLEGDSQSLTVQIDIRHPVTLDQTATAQTLEGFFMDHGFAPVAASSRPGLYYPMEHPLVTTLQSIYNEVTGEDARPIAIGGGTYAKGMPCPTVAFGPCFPWEQETAHMADEYNSISALLKAARIYAHALMQLSCLEEA